MRAPVLSVICCLALQACSEDKEYFTLWDCVYDDHPDIIWDGIYIDTKAKQWKAGSERGAIQNLTQGIIRFESDTTSYTYNSKTKRLRVFVKAGGVASSRECRVVYGRRLYE